MELLNIGSSMLLVGISYYVEKKGSRYFDISFRKPPKIIRKDATILLWS